MLRTTILSLLLFLFTACAPMIPAREFQINRFWRAAQEKLAFRTNGASYEVPSSMFRWRWVDHVFTCGDTWAIGCFDAKLKENGTPLITVYKPAQLFVIEHEACHGILFALGDSQWACHCHDLYGGGSGCSEGSDPISPQ